MLILGRILPFTGVLAAEAKIYSQAQNIYFDRINMAGGINGGKTVVKDYDDSSATDKAVIAANEAPNEDQVLMLIGGLSTVNGLAIVQIAEANKTTLIGTTTGAVAFREPPQRYIFPIRPSTSDEVNRMVSIGSKIGWDSYASVFQDDAFGKDGLTGLLVGAAREKANVVAAIPLDRAATEYIMAVVPAGKSKASLVMVFLPSIPATKFIRALK